MMKVKAFFRLLRPANIVTACADILAGFGIAAIPFLRENPDQITNFIVLLLLLLLSTMGLYGGGIVFNDVCDADLDRIERPERPIPKGIFSKAEASFIAILLWLIGAIAAGFVSYPSGFLALVIIFFSFFYDIFAKHHRVFGPISLGLCRAVNLLLGISIVQSALYTDWPLAFVPFLFIVGVSLISQEEVHAMNKSKLIIALVLYSLSVLTFLLWVLIKHLAYLSVLPFLLAFVFFSFSSLLTAIKRFVPQTIKRGVKIGILSLILLNAALAAGYAGWWYGLLILLLLPLSLFLAKYFAVT